MSALDLLLSPKKATAKKAAAPKAVELVPASAAPVPVATRSWANDQWEPWVEGQVPTGKRGVLAIRFEGGLEFHIGKGWLTK